VALPIVYPASLPAPQRWIGVPRERRALSAQPGNTQLRGRSRDLLQDIDAQWIYEPEQMEVWRAWFDDTLIKGQRWFALTILGAGGWISRTVRFRTGSVRREHVSHGVFRVSARLEQRGRSAPPAVCDVWRESFASLDPYAVTNGNGALFAVAGGVLSIAPQNTGAGNIARILRDIAPELLTARRFAFNFRLTTAAANDSGILDVLDNAGVESILQFHARRDAAFDEQQRARLVHDDEALPVSDEALAIGTWYRIVFRVRSGVGQSSCVLSELATGAVLKTTVYANAHPALTVDSLAFIADSGGLTSGVQYAAIEIDNCEE
jgi:hypothetical protein